MVSLLTMLVPLLLVILGCGLGGATPNSTPIATHPSANGPRLTGFVPDTDAPPAPPVANAGPPAGIVDLSANNPPVGSQGEASSCTSWATGYYLRGWFAKRDGAYPATGFNAEYIYNQAPKGAGGGTSFKDNLEVLKTQGVDTRGHVASASSKPTDAERTNAARYKIASYSIVSNPNHSANFWAWIVKRLEAGEPVALGLEVYDEFQNASPVDSYVSNVSNLGAKLPNHAVFVYGYESDGLMIENQWGPTWGNNGYAVLSWEYVRLHGLEAASIVPTDPLPTWQQLPGAVSDISVGADGSVWALGVNSIYGGHDILRWHPTTWTWETVPGSAVRIAVGKDGKPWVVNSFGNIWQWNGSGWDQAPGAARDIAIGANGAVWIIGAASVVGGVSATSNGAINTSVVTTNASGLTKRASLASRCDLVVGPDPNDGAIYQWKGGSWERLPGGGNRIAVQFNGLPSVINACGAISHWKGTAWETLPGKAKDIALGGLTCGCLYRPWMLGADASLSVWDEVHNQWLAVPGSAVELAAGPAYDPWVITNGGAIFQLPAAADFTALP